MCSTNASYFFEEEEEEEEAQMHLKVFYKLLSQTYLKACYLVNRLSEQVINKCQVSRIRSKAIICSVLLFYLIRYVNQRPPIFPYWNFYL